MRARLIPVLDKLGLPTGLSADPDKIYEAMLHDKKAAGGKLSVVRVNEVGSFELTSVAPEALRPLIAEVAEAKP